MEERRRVDDDHVVALLGDGEQVAEALLGDQLGVLGPKRRRQDVHARLMGGDVAGQCLGVELAPGHDQVVDGLVRLDPHHDGDVAELQVEVEQERPPLMLAGEQHGQVAGQRGLAGPALGREQRDDLALGVRGGLARHRAGAARGERVGLLDREHDAVGQLRQEDDVVDAGLQGLGQQAVGAGRRDQDDRGGGDRPDRLDLGRGHVLGRSGAVEDHLRGGLGQLGAGLDRICRRADEFDVGMISQALPDFRQAIGGARDEDLDRGLVGHRFAPDTQMGRVFLTWTSVRPVPKMLHGVATAGPVSSELWAGRTAAQN